MNIQSFLFPIYQQSYKSKGKFKVAKRGSSGISESYIYGLLDQAREPRRSFEKR